MVVISDERCKVTVSGLKIHIDSVRDIRSIMRSIQRRAPSTSMLNLSLICGEGNIDALLTVISSSYRFESRSHGHNIEDLMKLIQSDMLRQLKCWVGERA